MEFLKSPLTPNEKNSLVVWVNEWQSAAPADIYGQRVSKLGAFLGWFPITTGPKNQVLPALAYNAVNDEYLVVWMKDVGTGDYEIWGRRLSGTVRLWGRSSVFLPGRTGGFLTPAWPGTVPAMISGCLVDHKYG